MKQFFQHIKKRNWMMAAIICMVYVGNIFCSSLDYSSENSTQPDIDKNSFAGEEACRSCHKDIYDSSLHTAHYLTSNAASKEFIKGSFDSGQNIYRYNKFMYVQMDTDEDSCYQTAMINGLSFESKPFDIVVGSGRKGQTYLYWNDSALFQLPVSYYTALRSWCNSPGFPATISDFGRRVNAQCLECHGTYAKAQTLPNGDDAFDKKQIIYGITCERCHGAAVQHIAYHMANPKDTIAKFIINAGRLNRQQQLDACALCHSGLRKKIQPAFSFQIGNNLDKFSTPNYNADSASMLDVHGNQYGLLTASKCFRMSQMNCSSCHNVHASETGNMQTFSQRCMSCHNTTTHDTCTIKTRTGLVLANNCIDCHMPLMASGKIFLQLQDHKQSTADFVRTHKVAVYENETAMFINKMKLMGK